MYRSLIWLAVGAFAIGTESFVIAGILPALASDLAVPVALAGQLVTVFSLAYAIGTPVLAVVTGGMERKRLLSLAMAGFGAANLIAALAPNYEGLLVARVLLALAAGAFMPAASAYAATVAPPARRGRALAFIYTGFTGAMLVGVPVGTLVGDRFGWRMTFFGVAGLAFVALLGILLSLSRLPGQATVTFADRLAVACRRDILSVLLVTIIGMTGVFAVYTYLAPFLLQVAGFDGTAIAATLLVFGLGGMFGNLAGGMASDRFGPRRVLAIVLGVVVVLFAMLSIAAEWLAPALRMGVSLGVITLWGLFGWCFPTAQQTRLVMLDPVLAAVSLSLNSSATYFGVSLGAALGGIAVATGRLDALGWIGALCEIAALAILFVTAPAPVRQPVCPQVGGG